MNALGKNLPQKSRTTSLGFTLIELMVTIAVLAIIAGIAAPSISNQLANQRVKSTTSLLLNTLKEARVESVVRRQNITLTVDDSSDEKKIIITNTSTIASYGYDAKSTISAVDSAAAVTTTIEFKPSKTANERTFTICDSNANVSPRQIVVNALGNITSRSGGSC